MSITRRHTEGITRAPRRERDPSKNQNQLKSELRLDLVYKLLKMLQDLTSMSSYDQKHNLAPLGFLKLTKQILLAPKELL